MYVVFMRSYMMHQLFSHYILIRSKSKKSPGRSPSSVASVISKTSSNHEAAQHPTEKVKLAWEEESVSTVGYVVQANGGHPPGTR